jgi:hypothetical protein
LRRQETDNAAREVSFDQRDDGLARRWWQFCCAADRAQPSATVRTADLLPLSCSQGFALGKARAIIKLCEVFHLVDFAAHNQKGFRNHIASIAEVPALMKSFNYYGCYATYFFFSDEVLTYMSAQSDKVPSSIAGYEG